MLRLINEKLYSFIQENNHIEKDIYFQLVRMLSDMFY